MTQKWKHIRIDDFETFKTDSNTMHHAAQFLAYAAIHYISKKEDDSHTAMCWNPKLNGIVGQALISKDETYFLALVFKPFSLMILNKDHHTVNSLPLTGKRKIVVMMWLINNLKALGFKTDSFTDELHYSLPEHELDNGGAFDIVDENNLSSMILFRNNGHLILEHFAANFPSAQPVYIWPHHFDEACYVPMQKLVGKDIKSMNFGLAAPEEKFQSGYFYISAWSKGGLKMFDPVKIEPPGKWHNNGWTGQLLEIKDINSLSAYKQEKIVYSFMKKGIKYARQMAGWDYNF